MIYTERTKKAMKLILKAHKGQVDKGGYPYVYHPIHLAEQMKDESTCLVALLHDVLEDCPDYTMERVTREVGLEKEEQNALALLTHDESVPYLDYVKALSTNPIARKVKIADLQHNLDTARTDGRPPKKLKVMQESLTLLLELEK